MPVIALRPISVNASIYNVRGLINLSYRRKV